MAILQALFFPPDEPGGVSSMIPNIMHRMQEDNWKMELFYLPKRLRRKGKEEVPFETFDPAPYQESPIIERYLQTIKDYVWWTRLRIHERYSLIHCHHPLVAIAMKHVFPYIPVILTIHSSFETELMLNDRITRTGLEYQFLTKVYREVEEKVEVITTVSQSFKRYLGQYVAKPDRIQVIYNGFDQTLFRPSDNKSNAVPQIVSLSRLVPAKGIDVLIRACAELKRRGKPFVLHIIGDGRARPDLNQLCQELNVQDEIIFYGYMLHPHELMSFFDIFALPSRAEAFGSVFAEACLAGLACVGTQVGGIAEQIVHGKTGLLVPVDDAFALSDAIQTLIDDPAYRKKLAEAGRQHALQRFSLDRVVKEYEEIYKDILEINSWGSI
ncbi:glycosyltransferase family 4 protein [Fodinisporobacter ferrooxydans]|uniref:Glycosyltransferase family 4 protein n=1 Tax=Fodinisporobacter ferrooxydans TaxID=2901836 RepID=A0ABY4CU94_9BACL|nr:glycosyltransferase family 4 protein [Alicyclobacillaceae bacterium MYW30-H2]